MPPAAANRTYRATAIALMTVATLGHAVYLCKNSNPDLEMFVYMGKLVATGGRPGIDLIDNKFPTVGLLMSVPYRLLGANWLGYGGLSLAASIGAALILARGAKRTFGKSHYWPTLVAAMVWGNFFLCIFSLFQLEHLQLPLCAIAGTAALNALRRPDWRDALLVGLAAGLAAWLKPNALSAAAAFGAMLMLRSQWKLLAALVIGLAIPTTVAAICLHAYGTLTLLPEITRQIGRYAGHSAWNGSEVVSKFFDLALLFALPFAAAASLSLSVGRGRGRKSPSRAKSGVIQEQPSRGPRPAYREREVGFLFVWLCLELWGALLQGRLLPYYFLPLSAPAALLFGRFAATPNPLRLGIAFAPCLVVACIGGGMLWNNPDGFDDTRQLAGYFAAHNRAGGTVWADSYPRLAVESDWTPASRLPLINLLTNDDDAPLRFGRVLLDDLERNRPDLIVLRSDEDKLIRFFTQRQPDVAASPLRATRLRDTIADLYRFTAERYRPQLTCGPFTLWQRQATIEAAAAEGFAP